MNRFILVSSLFLIALSIILFSKTIQKYEVIKSNNFVWVTVSKLPNCKSGYKNKFLYIYYNNTNHIFRTKCKYVEGLQEGQKIKMLHREGTDTFLFKEENMTFDFIASIILALVGLICLIMNYNRNKLRLRTTVALNNQV
jgi:hypothetical protein